MGHDNTSTTDQVREAVNRCAARTVFIALALVAGAGPAESAQLCADMLTGDYSVASAEDIGALMSGLDGPVCIDGAMTISGTHVELAGLHNLAEVSGDLTIEGNDRLVSLHGLERLRHVGGRLLLHQNRILPSLTGLEGLETLRCISGDLAINGQYAPFSLAGLDSLSCVGGNLALRNTDLQALDGLQYLRQHPHDRLMVQPAADSQQGEQGPGDFPAVALCDAVGADLHIAYDEWNVVRPSAGRRAPDARCCLPAPGRWSGCRRTERSSQSRSCASRQASRGTGSVGSEDLPGSASSGVQRGWA